MKNPKVLGGGAVLFLAAFWFYIKPNYMDAKPPVVYTDAQISEAARPTLRITERVINLTSPAQAQTYAKVALALEFADPKHTYVGVKGAAIEVKNKAFEEELKPEMHRVNDVITQVISAKTVEQVSTKEGKEKLKVELADAINKQLHGEKVESVFFEVFITQ